MHQRVHATLNLSVTPGRKETLKECWATHTQAKHHNHIDTGMTAIQPRKHDEQTVATERPSSPFEIKKQRRSPAEPYRYPAKGRPVLEFAGRSRFATMLEEAVMTDLLEKAFEHASNLTPEQQDALAQWLLAELEDEKQWEARLASSHGVLAALVSEARREHQAGQTLPLVPDEL